MYSLKITVQKDRIATIIKGLNEVNAELMDKTDIAVQATSSPEWAILVIIFNQEVSYKEVNKFMDDLNSFKH